MGLLVSLPNWAGQSLKKIFSFPICQGRRGGNINFKMALMKIVGAENGNKRPPKTTWIKLNSNFFFTGKRRLG